MGKHFVFHAEQFLNRRLLFTRADKIFTVRGNVVLRPCRRSRMTRGGLTFEMKSEPLISAVRLNRQRKCKCVDYSRAGSCCSSAWRAVLEQGMGGGCWKDGREEEGEGCATRLMMDERLHQ